MDLLERYLAAVARQLPDRQKADVTAELRDELLSKAEDEEARLGRPLVEADWERLLIGFGNPLVVSGRYRRVQHLIGPEVFPFWWATIKVCLSIVAAIYLVLFFVEIASGDALPVHKPVPDLLTTVLIVFGAVTAVCAAIERFGKTAALDQWKPRNLPPADGRGRTFFEIAVELGMGLVVLCWWVGLIPIPSAIPPEIGVTVQMAPVWREHFWIIVAYLVFEAATNLLALIRPSWVRLNGGLRIARSLVATAIVASLLRAGHWLDVNGPWPDPIHAQVQANFDLGMKIGLLATLVVFVSQAAWVAWRLRQHLIASRPPAAARA